MKYRVNFLMESGAISSTEILSVPIGMTWTEFVSSSGDKYAKAISEGGLLKLTSKRGLERFINASKIEGIIIHRMD